MRSKEIAQLDVQQPQLTRRGFLRAAGIVAGAAALGGCRTRANETPQPSGTPRKNPDWGPTAVPKHTRAPQTRR